MISPWTCWLSTSVPLFLLAIQAVLVRGDSVLFMSNEYALGVLGDAPYQIYFSSDFTPAAWNFAVPHNRTTPSTPGYLFMAPRGTSIQQYGAVIYDESGQMVWNGNQYGEAMSFQVVTYKGEPHIVLWSGIWRQGFIGVGYGFNILLNQAYEVVANYTTDLDSDTGKTLADLHETQVTSNNTGLMTAYPYKSMDLSPYGGPTSGWLMDSAAQEVNITSERILRDFVGEALWTWRASEHEDPSNCYPIGSNGKDVNNPWDFFHINSIEKDDDGNFLISSRHCSTIYYLSGADGHIIWRLGGVKTSFEMGDGTNFSFQHDARWLTKDQKNATMSLFDNAGMSGVHNESTARGLILGLDFENMKATLIQAFIPWNPSVSESQGSVQVQPNGNVLIGWGQNPWVAEYNSSGALIWTTQFGVNNVQGYRALRYNWTGTPSTSPSLEIVQGKSSLLSVYASWNGATEINKWELLGSTSSDGTSPVSLYNKTKGGFETTITVGASNLEKYSHFAVRAIDRRNQPLGRSDFVQPGQNGGLKLNRDACISSGLLAIAIVQILHLLSL
ncbi:hypothetical protein V5O48_010675 [Marasmius crinis-equi]|uniref:ASST-domain-containing protein n=1 Tax=Marasmius crinis-equi TaxID=585013 RepID=A0ABR3F7P0_9AGAR